MALVPVLFFLLLFLANHVLKRWGPLSKPGHLAWAVLLLTLSALAIGVFAFFPWPSIGLGVVAMAGLASIPLLNGDMADGSGTRLEKGYDGFLTLQHAVFSGMGWVGVLMGVGGLVFLSAQAIPPFVRFALVFVLFLLAIRAGLACNQVLEQGEKRGRVQALGVLVIPLGVLLVFMLFDFGLGLDALRRAPDVPTFSEEFAGVGNVFTDVLRAGGLGGPVTRASIRSMAASDPDLLEEALAFAGPSEALFAAAPSRDQVWGGRAYAASDLTGTGFAGTAVLGRGVPTAVSYAENTFSVYVLSEHGALGGISVLLAYLSLLVVVGVWIFRVHATIQDTRVGLAALAMTVGGVLWLTLPAVYVAASNLALVPLTGQNMPFLGLNSWADVVLVSGVATGIVFGLTGAAEPSPGHGGSP
jgi:hypothetical protein